MITLADYWMGRDKTHSLALGPDIIRNASRMVALASELENCFGVAGVSTSINPQTGSLLTSGWRPPDINAATPGAAAKSMHMTGEAIDFYDPDGEIDEWLLTDAGQSRLEQIGLWHEHPSATKGWAHVQCRPPKSGRRTFYP
jgi:hypothetical protein